MTTQTDPLAAKKPMSAELRWDEDNKEWFAICPYCITATPDGIDLAGTYQCECGESFEVYAIEPVEEE